jgi:membrane fusion protein, multidrug efflux system
VQQNGVDDKGKPRMTALQRFVQLGATRGDQVAVRSGVAAGDVVVTAGQMKLRNGSPVIVNNRVMPSNDISPTPPNE